MKRVKAEKEMHRIQGEEIEIQPNFINMFTRNADVMMSSGVIRRKGFRPTSIQAEDPPTAALRAKTSQENAPYAAKPAAKK